MVKTNWKTKAALFCVFGVGYCVFYLLPNFFPFFTPVMLPQLPIDRATPLLPWTFLIYTSDYLFIYLAIVLLHGEAFSQFARQMFAALVLCGAFFIFFPTTYPRPVYPEVANALVAFAMSFVKNGDTPNNCFPSMHVALTGICLWNLRHKPRPVFFFYLTWMLAIFVSTLTTKQHYFVDILGGVSIVVTAAWLDRVYAARGVSIRSWLPVPRNSPNRRVSP